MEHRQTPTLLLALLGLYVAMLLTAMTAGSKVFAIGPLSASATVFPYAASFWVTDVVGELYGRRVASRLVLIGFGAMVLAALLLQLAVAVPPAAGYADQHAFAKVFGASPRLLLAGLGAYLVSQHLDVYIFDHLRQRTGGRHVWLRNNASTLCAQLVDTALFVTIAFCGVIDGVLSLIAGQYLLKAVIALLDTPLLYAVLALAPRGADDPARD